MIKFNNTALSTFLIISLLLSACSSRDNSEETKAAKAISVRISSPTTLLESGIHASGMIESAEKTNISTRVMGQILKINVGVGDYVKAGELLVTINSQDMGAKGAQARAMIQEAEANLKSAQKDYQRFTSLYQQQSASAKELDNATLQYNSASARLEAAKQMHTEVNAMMSYTSLRAPFSGVITQKMAEVGSLASPGMPLLVLEKSDRLQLSTSIAENQISKVKLNSIVQVNVKSIGKQLEGRVSEISPSSQLSGGQYIIKVSIPGNQQKDLYAGMYANAFIPTNENAESNNTLVPLSAIVNKDQLKGIYTISNNNTALLRWLRLGKVYGENIEVISGLGKADKFILSTDGLLYNGAPVIVKN